MCAQCTATLAVIQRETGTWGWVVFAFGYMTLLAYLGAFVVYQGTAALGWVTGDIQLAGSDCGIDFMGSRFMIFANGTRL